MKIIAAFVSTLAVASAFAPQSSSRASTQLSESLADKIFGMDLFSPNADVNDYGARNKMKKTKLGNISSNSYVPAGLTPEQYRKIREEEAKKKEANYNKNVAKAGKYLGFDEFYEKRGTDSNGAWLKAPGRGHTFAKTKYDYSGGKDETKGWKDAMGSIFNK